MSVEIAIDPRVLSINNGSTFTVTHVLAGTLSLTTRRALADAIHDIALLESTSHVLQGRRADNRAAAVR